MSRSRITCQGCKHRTTENQLKGSGGLCTHCGHDISKDRWLKHSWREIASLKLKPEEIDRLFDVARKNKIPANELIRLAVVSKTFSWDANPNKLGQDRMLHKLASN
jgi:hypothetical protein